MSAMKTQLEMYLEELQEEEAEKIRVRESDWSKKKSGRAISWRLIIISRVSLWYIGFISLLLTLGKAIVEDCIYLSIWPIFLLPCFCLSLSNKLLYTRTKAFLSKPFDNRIFSTRLILYLTIGCVIHIYPKSIAELTCRYVLLICLGVSCTLAFFLYKLDTTLSTTERKCLMLLEIVKKVQVITLGKGYTYPLQNPVSSSVNNDFHDSTPIADIHYKSCATLKRTLHLALKAFETSSAITNKSISLDGIKVLKADYCCDKVSGQKTCIDSFLTVKSLDLQQQTAFNTVIPCKLSSMIDLFAISEEDVRDSIKNVLTGCYEIIRLYFSLLALHGTIQSLLPLQRPLTVENDIHLESECLTLRHAISDMRSKVDKVSSELFALEQIICAQQDDAALYTALIKWMDLHRLEVTDCSGRRALESFSLYNSCPDACDWNKLLTSFQHILDSYHCDKSSPEIPVQSSVADGTNKITKMDTEEEERLAMASCDLNATLNTLAEYSSVGDGCVGTEKSLMELSQVNGKDAIDVFVTTVVMQENTLDGCLSTELYFEDMKTQQKTAKRLMQELKNCVKLKEASERMNRIQEINKGGALMPVQLSTSTHDIEYIQVSEQNEEAIKEDTFSRNLSIEKNLLTFKAELAAKLVDANIRSNDYICDCDEDEPS